MSCNIIHTKKIQNNEKMIRRWSVKYSGRNDNSTVTYTTISSHRSCSAKKGVLRNFTKFTGKHLCQSLFFNKFAGLRPATLLKKRLWHRCFPVNFVKFLRTPFLQNTSARLLTKLCESSEKVFFCGDCDN